MYNSNNHFNGSITNNIKSSFYSSTEQLQQKQSLQLQCCKYAPHDIEVPTYSIHGIMDSISPVLLQTRLHLNHPYHRVVQCHVV